MRHSKNGVCRSCSAKLLISLKLPKVSFEDLMGRDPAAPSSSSILSNGEWPSLVLYRLTVLDGAGWCPRVGSVVQLHLYQERFDIGMNDGTLPLTSVNLDSMRDMRIEGRSVSTGGGFIGGGFGVKGAVEGILAATVLNALTTRDESFVTIELEADHGWTRLAVQQCRHSRST
jgi:hypothetical protein